MNKSRLPFLDGYLAGVLTAIALGFLAGFSGRNGILWDLAGDFAAIVVVVAVIRFAIVVLSHLLTGRRGRELRP